MAKRLYIIEYESAHWCGGQSYVVVWAEDATDAESEAEHHMADAMRELFADEYDDDGQDADDSFPVAINSVEEFGPGNEHWKWYKDPSQESFYPTVGQPD